MLAIGFPGERRAGCSPGQLVTKAFQPWRVGTFTFSTDPELTAYTGTRAQPEVASSSADSRSLHTRGRGQTRGEGRRSSGQTMGIRNSSRVRTFQIPLVPQSQS